MSDKSKLGLVTGIAGAVLAVGIIVALSQPSTAAAPAAAPYVAVTSDAPTPDPIVAGPSGLVHYTISGTGAAGAQITMQTDSGTSQVNGSDGWSQEYYFDSSDFVYLSVQQQGTGTAITCTITEDDTVISTNTSTADYGIAECNGEAL